MPPASQALILPFTGAAALHVLLMRISHAQDAFAVFGWRPDSVYTNEDLHARLDEVATALDVSVLQACTCPAAVWTALYPVCIGALNRAAWAVPILFARLFDMDAQSAGETDTE